MIAIGHSSIGAIIGASVAITTPGLHFIPRALLAFTLGLISHYPADFIPHGHYHMSFKKNIELKSLVFGFFDVVLFGIFLMWLAFSHFGLNASFWLVGFGIAGALIPDVVDIGIYRLRFLHNFKWVKAHRHFHINRMHWHSHQNGRQEKTPRPLKLSADWLLVGLLAAAVVVIRLSI